MNEPGTDRDTDDALLLEVGRGSQDAFARFYDRFAAPVFSMIYEMTGDQAEAEDLLLEGMEEIWRKASNFDPAKSAAFTWTIMLMRSRTIDRLRKRASRARTLDKARSEAEPASEARDTRLYEWREERCLVRKAVDSMEEGRREMLTLSFFKGLTHSEIAEQTGKPLGTVKSTIRRSLRELRGIMEQEGYER